METPTLTTKATLKRCSGTQEELWLPTKVKCELVEIVSSGGLMSAAAVGRFVEFALRFKSLVVTRGKDR